MDPENIKKAWQAAAIAAGLEIYHFPRLSQWEERLRGDFGRS